MDNLMGFYDGEGESGGVLGSRDILSLKGQDVHEVSYRQSMAASEVGDNSSFKLPLDLSLACD